jgi:hypothetical protein
LQDGLLPEGTEADPFLAGDPDHQTQQPVWSPDGLLAFYDIDLASFVIKNPSSGEASRFPSKTGLPGSWEPDGEGYIVPEIFAGPLIDEGLETDLQPIPSSHLMRFNSQDGRLVDLTGADYLDDSAPAHSPTDGSLAFARKYLDLTRWTPGRQIWLSGSRGGEPRQITDEPFYNHYDFAWRPDGSQLAYMRFNQNVLTEPPELWLIDIDGTRPRQLVIGGYAPQWIP